MCSIASATIKTLTLLWLHVEATKLNVLREGGLVGNHFAQFKSIMEPEWFLVQLQFECYWRESNETMCVKDTLIHLSFGGHRHSFAYPRHIRTATCDTKTLKHTHTHTDAEVPLQCHLIIWAEIPLALVYFALSQHNSHRFGSVRLFFSCHIIYTSTNWSWVFIYCDWDLPFAAFWMVTYPAVFVDKILFFYSGIFRFSGDAERIDWVNWKWKSIRQTDITS